MKVLFFCAEHSAYTLMAAGLARHRFGRRAVITNAVPSGARPNTHAIRAMAELGIDITGDTSTTIQEIDMAEFDFVITICAEETCQCAVESSGNLHWCIDGPPSDNASLNPVEMRKRFGRIRDVIHARLASFQADHLK